MSKLANHVGLILLTQAVCLAVGLWMQYRFVVSSSFGAALETALFEMDADVDRLASALPPATGGSPSAGDLGGETIARWLDEDPGVRGDVVVVDGQWRVLSAKPSHAGKAKPFQIGSHVSWSRSTAVIDGRLRHMHGALESADGSLVAVAGSLERIEGYVLVCRSRSEIEAQSVATLGSLPAISALTFAWTCVLLGIPTYMILARFSEGAERDRARSVTQGLRQRQDLVRTRDAVVFGLAKLADSRDPDTGDHLERISVYSTTLASVLRRLPKYGKMVTPAFVRLIGISSALHDVGKVGIEDRILLKPERFTPDERLRMQVHTKIGGECLREIEQRLGSSNFLQMAREIAFAHHEWWDGSGYPNGLKGEEIPLAARIVAIADVYDALSSRRVYKRRHSHKEAVEAIRAAAGKQFDPTIVEAWLTVEAKFGDIARRYGDSTQATCILEPAVATGQRESVSDDDQRERLVSSAVPGGV